MCFVNSEWSWHCPILPQERPHLLEVTGVPTLKMSLQWTGRPIACIIGHSQAQENKYSVRTEVHCGALDS